MYAFKEDNKVRRQKRLADHIREEVYEVLRREVKDPRVRSFTVTEVNVSPDLRHANIFVCHFPEGDGHEPTSEEIEKLMKGLKSASHFVYEALKRRLVMRSIPAIHFEYDLRIAEGSRMWGLVKSLEGKS